jgi:hypothetical protein
VNKNLKTFGIVAGALIASQLVDAQLGLTDSLAGMFPESVAAETSQKVASAVVGGAVVATALVLLKGGK